MTTFAQAQSDLKQNCYNSLDFSKKKTNFQTSRN